MAKIGTVTAPLCPDSVQAGCQIRVASNSSFNVYNDGQSEVTVDVVAEVHDDKGNHNEITRKNINVPSGQKIEEELQPFFMAEYTVGTVTVTSMTQVSIAGDEGSTTTAQRVFTVTD